MAGILRNFQPALENVFLKIKKTRIYIRIRHRIRCLEFVIR